MSSGSFRRSANWLAWKSSWHRSRARRSGESTFSGSFIAVWDDEGQCRPPAVRAKQREFRRRHGSECFSRSHFHCVTRSQPRERAVRLVASIWRAESPRMYIIVQKGQGHIIEFVLSPEVTSTGDSLWQSAQKGPPWGTGQGESVYLCLGQGEHPEVANPSFSDWGTSTADAGTGGCRRTVPYAVFVTILHCECRT